MSRSWLALLAVLLLAPALPLPGVGSAVAEAKKDETAELSRLSQDMERLTSRNAWKGVVRKYREALELDLPIQPWLHMLAFEAARNQGDMTLARQALVRASTAEVGTDAEQTQARDQAIEQLSALDAAYGPVKIVVSAKRIPALVRPEMPFAMDQRTAIEVAQALLAEQRAFEGILPLGRYMVDGVFFEVVPGTEVLKVEVK